MSMIFDVEVNNGGGMSDHLSASEMDSSGGGMDFESSGGTMDHSVTPCRKESTGTTNNPNILMGCGGLFGSGGGGVGGGGGGGSEAFIPKMGGCGIGVGGGGQPTPQQPLSVVDVNVHHYPHHYHQHNHNPHQQQHGNVNVGGSGDTLKEQVLISHLTNATGCTQIQARHLLQASRWEFETALSMFFQDPGMSSPVSAAPVGLCPPTNQQHRITGNGLSPMQPPCNTPATPPSFPDALLALSKMQASDWSQPSPTSTAPSLSLSSNNKQVLSTCNHQQIVSPTTQERHVTNGQSQMGVGGVGGGPPQTVHQHTNPATTINPSGYCDWTVNGGGGGVLPGATGVGDRMIGAADGLIMAGNNQMNHTTTNNMIPKEPSNNQQTNNTSPNTTNKTAGAAAAAGGVGGVSAVSSTTTTTTTTATNPSSGPAIIGNSIGNNTQQQQIMFPIQAQP